ncbi:MAG: hypothetical protein K9I85_12440 [Saprospiraceae bacterium]|nr:hypothetical protein [Saprospiraceae bacterium]
MIALDTKFYFDLFQKEEMRRNSIEGLTLSTLSFYPILLAGYYVLLSTFKFQCSHIGSGIVFSLFLLLFSIFIACAMYHLSISYNNGLKGFEYHSLPTASNLNDYCTKLKKWCEAEGHNFDEKFNEYLVRKLIIYIDINNLNNNIKYNSLFLSKKYGMFACIFLAFSLIPYFYAFFT